MTPRSPRPVLDAVVRVALEATGATRGRLVAHDPAADGLEVVAVQGGDAAWQATNPDPDSLGGVGYVMATGQPQILSRRDAGPAGAPSSALCAPCMCHDEVVGALELADKASGVGFTFDDLELASLLAGVAGEAIVARRTPPAIDPGQLIGELGRLAAADPGRYATVARLVQSLLHA